ncbi:MAG: hypothetical protein Pars2KO_31970 [Parasphingorhabdus sp.]
MLLIVSVHYFGWLREIDYKKRIQEMQRSDTKTKKAILDAVRELLPKFAWQDISITMICDLAQVSRTSFYSNFDTKDDLMAAELDRRVDEFTSHCPMDRGLDVNGTFGFFPPLLKMWKSTAHITRRQQSVLGRPILWNRLAKMTSRMIKIEIERSLKIESLSDSELTLLGGAVSGLLKEWLETGFEKSADEILTILDRFAVQNVKNG